MATNIWAGLNFYKNCKNSLSFIKGVPANKNWASFSSWKGRAFCLLAIPSHLAEAVIKPAVYGACVAFIVVPFLISLIVYPFFDEMFNGTSTVLGHCLVHVITSPFLNVYLAAKACFGLIDPNMYFKYEEDDWAISYHDEIFRSF